MQFGNRPFGHRPFWASSLQGSFGFGVGAWVRAQTQAIGCVTKELETDSSRQAVSTQAVWARKLWQAVWEWQRGDGSDLGMAVAW